MYPKRAIRILALTCPPATPFRWGLSTSSELKLRIQALKAVASAVKLVGSPAIMVEKHHWLHCWDDQHGGKHVGQRHIWHSLLLAGWLRMTQATARPQCGGPTPGILAADAQWLEHWQPNERGEGRRTHVAMVKSIAAINPNKQLNQSTLISPLPLTI